MSDPSELSFRVRVGDRARRHGLTPPPGYAEAPPLVTWRRGGCRDRLLRVFLSPEGWTAIGDDFRVPPDEWRARFDVDETVYATNLRRIRGLRLTLPLDEMQWGALGALEIGCDHAITACDLADLAKDCRQVRDTRRPTSREVD